MTRRVRLSATALLLAGGGLLIAACGGGDGATIETQEIALTGSALEDFVGGLVLTREDVPGALVDVPEEQWQTDPSAQPPFVGDFDLVQAGWLGTLGRPFFVRSAEGRTFTVANAALAFRTPSGAQDALDFIKSADVNEQGEKFVETTYATAFEVQEFDLDVGEDYWSLVLTGPAELEGAREELLSALIVFRRGPIVAMTGMFGFVDLDERLLRELAGKLDERIQAGLEGLS